MRLESGYRNTVVKDYIQHKKTVPGTQQVSVKILVDINYVNNEKAVAPW